MPPSSSYRRVSHWVKVPLLRIKNRLTILLARTRTMTMRSKKARILTTPARKTMVNSEMIRVRAKMYLLSKMMIIKASILGVPEISTKEVPKI